MLTAFATYLLETSLKEVASQAGSRIRAAVPWAGQMPHADLEAIVYASAEELLRALSEGRAVESVASRIQRVTGGAVPGIPPAAQARDSILIYTSHKQAIVGQIEGYVTSVSDAVQLCQAVETMFDDIFAAAMRVVIASGSLSAGAAVPEEELAAALYAVGLEAMNQRLEAEVARKRAILDAALDAVVTINQDNRVIEFNPAAEVMFGFTAEEMLGRDMVDLIVPERHRDAHRRGMKHFLATGEGPALSKRVELPALRRDGSEFPAEFVIIHLALESQTAFTSFIRDLTEQKAASKASQELEAMRRADVLKDHFLSILSHELRTPINAITGFGSILEDGVAGPLTGPQQGYVHKILTSADALLVLVDDLLDMSRIQAGKFSISLAPMVFRQVADEALAMLVSLAQPKGIELVDDIAPDLPEIVGDANRVTQVLINLIGNAIKFSSPGSTVTLRARLEGADMVCEVVDTGKGIAPEDQVTLFQRFSQVSVGNTREAKGTGLGLSISKAIVEAHGGTIGVISAPGRGSTFWFRLPPMPTAGEAEPGRAED